MRKSLETIVSWTFICWKETRGILFASIRQFAMENNVIILNVIRLKRLTF